MQSEYLEELTTNQTEAISGGTRLTFNKIDYFCRQGFPLGGGNRNWEVTWQGRGGQGRYRYFCRRLTPLPPPSPTGGFGLSGGSPSIRPDK